MSNIERDERAWTIRGISAYGDGHPTIIAAGPWPKEPTKVVPVGTLQGAVERVAELERELERARAENAELRFRFESVRAERPGFGGQ